MIKEFIQGVLRLAGLELRRLPVRGMRSSRASVTPGSRVDVGCGPDCRDGYIGCDVRPLDGVHVVCRAWELSNHCRDLAEVYSRHALEHLTLGEAQAALDDWHDALAVGGRVHIIVPHLEFHIAQWMRAAWSNASMQEQRSDARWGFAGLYGWQRQCDPRQSDYDTSYWDTHKSGYSPALLGYLLRCAGFSDIQVRVEDECHLVAEATKIVQRGERQVAPSADGIRPDHRARYEFACQYVPDSGRVLDIACGVGYGAWILATGTPATEIIGVDRDQGALEYAEQNFANPKVHFRAVDALDVEFPSAAFDAIVSFETVEHLPQAAAFLQRLRGFLRPGGVLVCSTPNEVRMPFQVSRFPYHHRHFTPEEFRSLLNAQGFTVYGEFSQEDAATPEVSPGWAGSYLIAVCRKAPGDE